MPQLMTMKIIAIGLIAGVMTFTGVMVVMNLGEEAQAEPFLLYLGIAFAPIAVVASFIAQNAVGQKMVEEFLHQNKDVRAGDDKFTDWMLAAYQTKMIVDMCILEGVCLFNAICYAVDGNWVSLGVIAGLLVFMAMQFPSETSVNQWLEVQEQKV